MVSKLVMSHHETAKKLYLKLHLEGISYRLQVIIVFAFKQSYRIINADTLLQIMLEYYDNL